MPTILISYRRADSSAVTGRIFDHLSAYYGEESIFMDVDNIPLGVDFRDKIKDTLARTDVVVAVIGSNWLGAHADGSVRMHEPTDPVRVEIETAVAQKASIIPVLVDGAKMPGSALLPSEFGNFAYLNAAEVANGRDFRAHVERLIREIDRTLSGDTDADTPGRIKAVDGAPKLGLSEVLQYLAMPLVVLLASHHVIVNVLDLKTEYLWIACLVVPLVFGFLFCWATGSGALAAVSFSLALGLISVIGMDISGSLKSGEPIIPQDRVEWSDNVQFFACITFSYLVGHALARALSALRRRKLRRV
jgi:hypothetical protein